MGERTERREQRKVIGKERKRTRESMGGVGISEGKDG